MTTDLSPYDPASTDAVFDAKAAFTAEVEPLPDQLIAACKIHGIPLLVSACYGNETDYSYFKSALVAWADRCPPRHQEAIRVIIPELFTEE